MRSSEGCRNWKQGQYEQLVTGKAGMVNVNDAMS